MTMSTSNLFKLNWKDDSYYDAHPAEKELRDACIERANWNTLREYASSRNSGRPCTLLEQSTIGSAHLIRLLRFENPTIDTDSALDAGTDIEPLWIARVNLTLSTPESESLLRYDLDAMDLIRSKTTVPVPKVYGYELSDDNAVRAAFTLMQVIPGFSVLDAEGAYGGRAPVDKRKRFIEKVAGIQVQLSSIRFPQIGKIIRRLDGTFDIDPFPSIGGPFSTASGFLETWAAQARPKAPISERTIRERLKYGPIEKQKEVLMSLREFPDKLEELARIVRNSRPESDSGPFPLYYSDLHQGNILVDDEFGIIGVLGWEGLCTMPWELVQPPPFISRSSRATGSPSDAEDPGSADRLEEREEYVKILRQKEDEMGVDSKLSTILGNDDIQALARVCG
ncbi:hypothetical protein BDW74DRAFT_109910 [Aspergillus multicolor]|uniref:uncharacterized protein n=1 Tax=Aspergillus multicolor TaxID=41759 RepID=UPI003CCD96C5